MAQEKRTDYTKFMTGHDYDRGYTFRDASKEVDVKWTELLKRPRVIKAKDIPPLVEGEPYQGRMVDIFQTGQQIAMTFFLEMAPGGVSQRHCHMNEACFYILEGEGHEIHDGERFDWEAGDVVIVPAGCVHRHVNHGQTWARAWVTATLPLYHIANLKAQRLIDHPWEGPT